MQKSRVYFPALCQKRSWISPGEKTPSSSCLAAVKSLRHLERNALKDQIYRGASSFRARLQSSENHDRKTHWISEWQCSSLTYSYMLWIYTVFCFRIYCNGVQVGFLQKKERSYLCYKYCNTKYEGSLLEMCAKLKHEIQSGPFQGWITLMMFTFAVTKMEKRQWESPSTRRLWSASPKPSHCSQNRCWIN